MNTKTFVKTKNVKKFVSLMDRLKKLPPNIPKLALVYGSHGLGKTQTLIWWATKNDAIYIRANNDITQNGLLKEILLDLSIRPFHSMQDNLDEIDEKYIINDELLDKLLKYEKNPLFYIIKLIYISISTFCKSSISHLLNIFINTEEINGDKRNTILINSYLKSFGLYELYAT